MDVSAPVDEEEQIFAEEYLRGVANGYAERMYVWIDSLAHQPKEWADAGTISDWMMRLTPDQALQVTEELSALVQRLADENPAVEPAPAGTDRVFVQLQVLTAPSDEQSPEEQS